MGSNLPRNGGDAAPRVSVLVPVRDGMPHLAYTWNTLRRLRWANLQFVFVDDGSRDGTADFLAAAARESPHPFLLLRQAAEGLVPALERGLAACTGRYVARLDADDLIHPDRIVRQVALAEAAGLDVVGSGVRSFPAGQVRGGLRRYEAWQNSLTTPEDHARDRFVESPLVHPSVLMRRDAIWAAGGYRARPWPEDYDLWLRLLERGARIAKVPEVLTYWRERPERLTRTAPHCTPDALAACKAEALVRGPLVGRDRVYVAGAGDDAKRLVRALDRAGRPVAAYLDLNPRRIGQRIGGVPVCRLEDAGVRPGDGSTILAAIGGAGRRDDVRRYFIDRGYRECVDFWCAA